jgi:PAS domain S-box-containing protein
MPADAQTNSAIHALKAELRAAGTSLADNEDLLRAVLAGSGDCIKILDLDGRLQFMSEGGKRVMEVDDFGQLQGCAWPDFWADAGHQQAAAAVETARQGKIARFKGAAKTAKGTPRFWDVQVSPIYGEDGAPAYLLSISRDITDEWRTQLDLKESAERQRVLTEELQHRIKNTLAMVGAIANQTMRGQDVDEARKAFLARLHILSRAHDVLTQTSWSGATIADVVHEALKAHEPGPGRIQVSGPVLQLNSKQALALALSVHELATNAAKYGALSNNAGTVQIEWSTPVLAGLPTFTFKWSESGGPAVAAPTETGFGTRLLDRVLKSEFQGDARIDYAPGGVVYEVTAPLDHVGGDADEPASRAS